MAVRRLSFAAVIVLVLALLVSSAGATGIVVAQQEGTVQSSSGTSAVATSTGSVQKAPVNPSWTKYKEDVAAGRVEKQSPAGHGLGAIPGIVDPSHLKTITPALAQALPATYDLRTLGKVSPVGYQDACGSCWAFATYGSLESNLLPTESWQLSENSLKNQHGFDLGCCDGGGYLMSTAYLTRWGGTMRGGPVTETCDKYALSCGDSTACPIQKHVQNVIFLAPRANEGDNGGIKSAVQKYGGVYATMFMDETGANYNPSTHAYCYTGGANLNHAVTIVGWNDAYPASNFATQPRGAGAFIVKNSWGTSWGDHGFFYVSYYDTVFARNDASAAFTAEPTTNYATNYQYDPLGYVGTRGVGTDVAWGANIFTAKTGTLKAIGLYTVATNTEYTIQIYTNPTTSPTSGTLVTTQSGSKTNAGYYTIPLQTSVPLTAGQKFSVVIKFRTPGYNWPLAIQERDSGYSSAATNAPGQSYYSSDGSTWKDWYSYNGNADVISNCIKAFSDNQAPTTTTITASRTFPSTTQPVTFTVTVKTGSNALARPVHIWHTTPSGAKYDDGTHTTSGGKYTFTVTFTTPGQRTYHADFAGDTTYAKSSGYKTVYTGYTITRITASNTNPTTTQPVTFTVTVTDYAAGVKLARPVKIWHTTPSGVRYDDGTHTTSGGTYTFTVTFFGSAGKRTYHAEFAGDTTHMKSSGSVVVNVGG